ncbi:MAG: hypothetical protein DCF16_18640 [Alphaproteobacteria bacterium]|nr:MAG: hypothetical protein DCF16_18640 [Alphaproteobacteria bacterium]
MSIIRTTVIAALLSVGFAGAAYARNEVATIRLSAPAEDSRIIAVNTLWSCDGETCLARPNHGITVRACRQFLRQTGAGVRVVSYGTEERALTAEELARCNGDTLEASN